MFHFLLFFVCSSLPLDFDIFSDFCFLLFMKVVFSLLTIFFLLLQRGPQKVLLMPLTETLDEAQMGAQIRELSGAHCCTWVA